MVTIFCKLCTNSREETYNGTAREPPELRVLSVGTEPREHEQRSALVVEG